MTDLIAKCAWCQKEPDKAPGIEFCICATNNCLNTVVADVACWNDLQARILEARRKDFEAGYYNGLASNQCGSADPGIDFDDYIKGGK